MSDTETYSFFPEIEPNKDYMLTCGNLHNIYVEESGNPNGQPVIFLHGGPGGGCGAKQRRFFDPKHYRIILCIVKYYIRYDETVILFHQK